MEKVKKIIEDLKKVEGLYNPILVPKEFKDEIISLEDKNNLGIRECLNREYCLFVLHNSEFREPVSEIVIKEGKKVILPAVGFPEVDGKNVVSSSPSLKVHEFLSEKFELDLEDEEASLLIGFEV